MDLGLETNVCHLLLYAFSTDGSIAASLSSWAVFPRRIPNLDLVAYSWIYVQRQTVDIKTITLITKHISTLANCLKQYGAFYNVMSV